MLLKFGIEFVYYKYELGEWDRDKYLMDGEKVFLYVGIFFLFCSFDV